MGIPRWRQIHPSVWAFFLSSPTEDRGCATSQVLLPPPSKLERLIAQINLIAKRINHEIKISKIEGSSGVRTHNLKPSSRHKNSTLDRSTTTVQTTVLCTFSSLKKESIFQSNSFLKTDKLSGLQLNFVFGRKRARDKSFSKNKTGCVKLEQCWSFKNILVYFHLKMSNSRKTKVSLKNSKKPCKPRLRKSKAGNKDQVCVDLNFINPFV